MERIALVFPGQGSQYVGMGEKLCAKHKIARDVYDEANEVLGYDLKSICFKGRVSELNRISNMFPAILTTSYAIFKVYMEEVGIEPACMAGHSLGEITALVSSEAISFADALKLIQFRSELAMQVKEQTHGILGIIDNLECDRVERICNDSRACAKQVDIACYNAMNQLVLAGVEDAVLDAGAEAQKLNASFTPLLYSPPFHSLLMKDIIPIFKNKLMEIDIENTRWPVVSNIDCSIYSNKEQIINNMAEQLRLPVQWHKTMQVFENYSVDTVIESGPLALISNLAERYNKNFCIYSFGQENDRENLMNQPGQSKKESDYCHIVKACMTAAVAAPNKNENILEYSDGVVTPYNNIKEIYIKRVNKKDSFTLEDAKNAVAMLLSVYRTKEFPKELQKKRLGEISQEVHDTEVKKYIASISELSD